MKILIIDDKPEQLEAAVEIVKSAGHETVTATTLEEIVKLMPSVDGVLSDLEFNPVGEDYSIYETYEEKPPQSGILVVILALKHGKEISICTDGYHHGEKLSWIFDALFGAAGEYVFGWNDQKDWKDALDQLIWRCENSPSG